VGGYIPEPIWIGLEKVKTGPALGESITSAKNRSFIKRPEIPLTQGGNLKKILEGVRGHEFFSEGDRSCSAREKPYDFKKKEVGWGTRREKLKNLVDSRSCRKKIRQEVSSEF